jgi:O-antigen biosynthesis protein
MIFFQQGGGGFSVHPQPWAQSVCDSRNGREHKMTDRNEHFSGEPGRNQPFAPADPVRKIYFQVKRWLRSCRFYFADSHYRALVHSGLFDTRYYLANDPGLDPRYVDPRIHYLEAGWREGRKPNPLFDSAYYREINPAAPAGDPLLHYIEKGWREGADPPPLFFSVWYAAEYPESVRRGSTPLGHYLRIGWRLGNRPNPHTDFSGYLAAHPELAAQDINPLTHFLDGGYRTDPGPLPFFDEVWYLEDNPSAAGMAITPLLHYLRYGVREGRFPNRFFDPQYYLACHPEAGPSGLTAFLHFNGVGYRLDNRPWPLFDPGYYARTYPEYAETHAHPLLHYQEQGTGRQYYPCAEVAELAEKPLISVITPVYNTDALLLRRCIHSVLYQAYPHWELCLVDDGSDRPHVRQILEEYAARDPRIRVRFLKHNRGIAEASNAAAAMAGGDYLGFLDHDDELTLDALYEAARVVNDQGAEVIYTDEDLVNLESRRLDNFFKPDYNPELLLTHNYITHFLVARRELFLQTGGFSPEFEGAQDYDLALKLTELTGSIVHIPRPLYHWRASDTSTSVNHARKAYADGSGRRAVEAALCRRGIAARVEPGEWKFFYRVRRMLPERPLVTLVVRLSGDGEGPEEWLDRMAPHLCYEPLAISLATKGTPGRGVERPGVRIHAAADDDSPAAIYNRIARQSTGRHLLFVDPEFVPRDEAWISALLEFSEDRATGAVTGRIESDWKPGEPSGAGEAMTWDRFRSFFLYASRDANNVFCEQNVLAVPIGLCMVKRELYDRAGGFDEVRFPRFFFDIDFCLRLREMGLRNVYTPVCSGERLKTNRDMVGNGAGEKEFNDFRTKWRDLLRRGDPYYNPGRVLAERGLSRGQWLDWYAGE